MRMLYQFQANERLRMMVDQRLSKALREKKEAEGWGLREMSRELEVATGTAEGYLKGWRLPSREHVDKVAAVLGITKLELFFMVGDIDASDLEALPNGDSTMGGYHSSLQPATA